MKAPEFICNVAGIQPATTKIRNTGDTVCAKCGTPILNGDAYSPFKTGASFTDYASLSNPNSDAECGYCIALSTVDNLRALQFTLITEHGWYRLTKDSDRASMLLNPPDGRWVALIASGNQQHLAWKAPINQGRDAFTIRLGTQTVTIWHKRLLEACRAQSVVLEAARTAFSAKKQKFGNVTVFSTSGDARHMKTTDLRIMDRLYAPEIAKQCQQELSLLESLSIGERWAVFTIGCSKLTPETVTPFVLIKGEQQ